jgi:hypothetical protein
MKSLWTLPEKIMAGNSYEFEELEGRTLAELEGLGVISRFDDGNLISKWYCYFFKIQCWYYHVFASTSEDTEPALKALGLDAGLTNGLTKLLRSSLALSLSSEVEQQTQELANVGQGQIILPVLWMLWLESMHLLWKTTWTL